MVRVAQRHIIFRACFESAHRARVGRGDL
jgi:hypothetical protein